MFLPMPFFWALFDMKGSKWVITATQVRTSITIIKYGSYNIDYIIRTILYRPYYMVIQTNGWIGGDAFKIKPDQIQLANPIMILLLLPLFTNVIYPLIERCGIKVTLLRRMSLGQIITGLVRLKTITCHQRVYFEPSKSIIIRNGGNCSKLD